MRADASARSRASSAVRANEATGGWKQRLQILLDRVFDAHLQRNADLSRVAREADALPVRNILVTAVEVPSRRAALDDVVRELQETRHSVTIARAEMQPGKGKFENIGAAIVEHDLDSFDWLLVVDDDVVLPPAFLDRFLFLSEKFNLAMSQPAHRFHSFTTWPITRRSLGTLARQTRFVECGPVTAFHRSTFADALPFPPSRWGWGLDFLWAETALRKGLSVGVVDALPMRHTRPVGGDYALDDARVAMKTFLESRGVTRPRREYMVDVARWKRLPKRASHEEES